MKRLLYVQVDLTLKTQQKHNKFKSENFRKKKEKSLIQAILS